MTCIFWSARTILKTFARIQHGTNYTRAHTDRFEKNSKTFQGLLKDFPTDSQGLKIKEIQI